MIESLAPVMPFMIPILGLLLGFVVLAGIFVVQPLTKVLEKVTERQGALDPARAEARLQSLEDRMASLEGTLVRLTEAQEFERELRSGPTPEG